MFGNVAVYIGDKSFEEIIHPNCLLYFYSKNENELEMQKKDIQDCCEKWNIVPSKIYEDVNVNILDKNSKFNKLLEENTNNDIIIVSNEILCMNEEEMEKIKELCKSKNLKIYSKAEVNFFYIVTKSYVDMKNEDLEL